MLLHEMSILECKNDLKRNKHFKEVEDIMGIIVGLPNYNCILNIRKMKKDVKEEVLTCHFHQILEIYESEDFTNGADFEIGDSNVLTLTMYGNLAVIDGQLQPTRTVYQILSYTGDIRNLDTVEFIDISSRFVSSKSLCFSSLATWKN